MISTETACITLLGNGATTVWDFPFVADNEDDLIVTYINVSGGEEILDPSLYTVTINAVPPGQLWGIGGSVTYPNTGSPPIPIVDGTFMNIKRAVPYTQTVAIGNQGAFYPQAVEQGLDLLELQIQQLGCLLDDIQSDINIILASVTHYDYPLWIGGATSDGEIFTGVNIVRTMTLQTALSGSVFSIGILPTANTVLILKKNSSTIGTITFHTNGSHTVSFTQDVTFVSGDQFKVVNQATADATAGNISLTFIFDVAP